MDLSRARGLFEHDGPFTTLHVEVGRVSEDAAQQIDARWTTIRHDLERADTDDALLGELEGRVREQTHLAGEVRRTLVAAGDRLVFDDVQSGHSYWPETVDHGALPDLAGWLTMAARAIPFVLVVADRIGADIELHRALSSASVQRETVQGDDFYVTKVSEGDWAQKQFQQSAENTWQHNARLVADTVRGLLRSGRPRVVFLAGEERARSEVARALDAESALEPSVTLVQVVSGGRAAGASRDALWQELRTGLAELEAGDDRDLATRLDEARRRGEGAATGIDEVLDALGQARVGRLVLDLDVMHERVVHPGSHPGLPLPSGAAKADQLPADRVLLAAAALSGADVSVLPAELSHGGGVSALLRWTT
jgi:Bacterial archaeo-eukaryotic release factor family 2